MGYIFVTRDYGRAEGLLEGGRWREDVGRWTLDVRQKMSVDGRRWTVDKKTDPSGFQPPPLTSGRSGRAVLGDWFSPSWHSRNGKKEQQRATKSNKGEIFTNYSLLIPSRLTQKKRKVRGEFCAKRESGPAVYKRK